MKRRAGIALLALSCTALSACAGTRAPVVASTPMAAAADEQARVRDLVSRMSLERKVAQLIQPQINSFTAAEMAQYRFGSDLNGGNGGPYGDEFAPASEWLRLADEMWDASTRPLPDGEPVVPTMWGTDAVHGHTNVVGATIFPHNIGLGATRDADLVRRIGEATATEIEVTGIDWNFSPTVAVARDDRWGRTYESYSEDPHITARLGAALVEGLQGRKDAPDRLGKGHVLATAKHFFGDGGTQQGVDQGDVNGALEELKPIHVTPYPAAIAAGVETVMASFNSINGRKMHGNRELLTGLLRGELGFEGLVVGDWNGHGQIAGCTVDNCPQALLAGLDIYMVPDDWKALHANLVAQVRDGTIPMARLDEAVGRVLTLKLRAGLLEQGAAKPSARPNAGDMSLLGSATHRAIAREAVAKSLVILKNNGVLPIRPGANVVITGSAADDIARQAGGWSLTWQGGGDLTNANFPGATSIGAALAEAVRDSGGSAIIAPGDAIPAGSAQPDVAIVVFGEAPYAEFAGDRKDLAWRDERHLALLKAYRAAGVPTVAVFLSGRPLWVNRELNAADAFVAAWLPGSEGGGVADVLTGKHPATGKLSFSWPARCEGEPLNSAEGALFALGYGRSLADTAPLATLDESCSVLAAAPGAEWFGKGRLADGARAQAGDVDLVNLRGEGAGITARGIDRNAQEDAREIAFAPGAALTLSGPTGEGALVLQYRIDARPAGKVTLAAGASTYDATQSLSVAEGKGWRTMVLTRACLAGLDQALTIRSDAPLRIAIAQIARDTVLDQADCSF